MNGEINYVADLEIVIHEAMELYPLDIEKKKEYVNYRLKELKEMRERGIK